ncbi:MAG: hypothetical protein ACRDOY_04355 [Nocardioidaceae bacterium]
MAERVADKAMTGLVGVGMIAVLGWGITYVPILSDYVPGIITAPAPTVHLDVRDITPNDVEAGRLPGGLVENACDKIPFLLRPIASKPSQARVIFDSEETALGEATFNCRDGAVVRSKEY